MGVAVQAVVLVAHQMVVGHKGKAGTVHFGIVLICCWLLLVDVVVIVVVVVVVLRSKKVFFKHRPLCVGSSVRPLRLNLLSDHVVWIYNQHWTSNPTWPATCRRWNGVPPEMNSFWSEDINLPRWTNLPKTSFWILSFSRGDPLVLGCWKSDCEPGQSSHREGANFAVGQIGKSRSNQSPKIAPKKWGSPELHSLQPLWLVGLHRRLRDWKFWMSPSYLLTSRNRF